MKLSIRTKLMLIMLGIVFINYVIIISFGSTFVETYYQDYKEDELINYGNSIKRAYVSQMPFDNTILSGESRNLTFLLFRYKSQKSEIDYFSRPTLKEREFNAKYWISESISNGVFVSLELSPTTLFSVQDKNQLSLYMLLQDNTYLFISTPLDYISATAELSIRFFTYLSLLSLLIGSILIFIVSGFIAKPIIRISNVTKKIAQLKFDEKCKVKGKDEITELASNVNMMAKQIEENLSILIEKNALLLKDLNREAETGEIRRQFIANVSHDFKTPLSLIQAYSEVLKENTNSEEDIHMYHIILDQVKQMNLLVNQLLSLSQLESGLVALDLSFFSLNDVIESVLSSMIILSKNSQIQVDFASETSYIVSGDYQKLVQVFTNLLENSIKYAPLGDTIQIRLRKNLQRVVVEVSNAAPAEFTMDQASHLFDSFYKLDSTRNVNQKSYGLGLAIVKAIMELHEQNFGCEMRERRIVFYVTLDIYSILDEEDESVDETEIQDHPEWIKGDDRE